MAENNSRFRSSRGDGLRPIFQSRDSSEEDTLVIDSNEEDIIILDLSEENIVYFGEESPHQPGDLDDLEGDQVLSAAVPESSSCSTGNRRRKISLLKCEYCSKEYISPYHFERHLRTHTGEQPFVSSICQNDFKQKSNLERHKVTHFRIKPYSCSDCRRKFTKRRSLKNHVKRLHSDHDGRQ